MDQNKFLFKTNNMRRRYPQGLVPGSYVMVDVDGEEWSPGYEDEEFFSQGKIGLFMSYHTFHRLPLVFHNV